MTIAPLQMRVDAELELRRRRITADNNPYRADFDYTAIAWHESAWHDQSFIKLYTGSAGGGKSRLAAEEVNDFMFSYGGATGLMLRKTRESMNNSTCLLYTS